MGVWQANGKALLGSTAEFAGELELQYDYPDEYVVFLDDWVGEGRKRRLVRRVLAHGPPEETKRLSDVVAALPFEDRRRIQFIYIRDPFLNEVWI